VNDEEIWQAGESEYQQDKCEDLLWEGSHNAAMLTLGVNGHVSYAMQIQPNAGWEADEMFLFPPPHPQRLRPRT
jgi:hypothetical protein